MRFYAGSLLRLPDQRPLGTRCLIDRRPRRPPRRHATGARPAGRPGQPGHCPAPPLPGPAPGSAEQYPAPSHKLPNCAGRQHKGELLNGR
ncbi:hypothetical protein [Hymenobacter volaticus]|uniref:Uncharacterized protein n=1 Tax=Hymenobacter volaticus TaxID=2932254 RepID=A0ABY4GEI1_9BACT|nr:hypothetical protein [Hymenobacter volaticus]UOQ69336.1 hypothetical protein MUN86_26945 [Hymenobacter volaticus]